MAKQTKQQIGEGIIALNGKLKAEKSKANPDPKEVTRLTNQLKVLAAQYKRVSPAKLPKDDKREELTNLAETDPEGLAMSFIQSLPAPELSAFLPL